jgi:Tfp pilus assembly protein PilN
LQPVVQAGFLVEGVTTPCGALWSQAKLRRPTVPGEVHAYVVLGVSTSALAIFSNGFLLYGRDFNWGYAVSDVGIPVSRDRGDLATRLAAELRQSFLYVRQYWEEDVSQVLLCGEMPEIRSLTAPLIELLNIEVETLDTLDGIDTSNLPEGFADDAAAFRLASSIAVEPPPANLLPVQVTAQRVNRRSHRAFAAGSAAAVACAAFLYGHASVVIEEAQREIDALHVERLRSNSETLQRTAVESLDGSASRMVRVFEVLPAAVPRNVIIKALRALAAGDSWHVSIEAVATGPDLARAQMAIDTFLRALQSSPLFSAPLREPLRLVNDAGAVELTAEYSVRK